MNKIVTKYKSLFDRTLLSVLIIEITLHFKMWLNYLFRNLDGFWWLTVPLTVLFGVVTTVFITILYWKRCSVEYAYSKILDRVLPYGKMNAPYWHMSEKEFNYDILVKKAPKLIDDICKATTIPIERRKILFDTVCNMWTEEGKEIPPYIIKQWKMAIIEYKKYEIWMN